MPISLRSIDWDKALCRDVEEKDRFHLDQHRGKGRAYAVKATARAKEICNGCPIFEQCLEYALDHPGLEGVYAATTTNERKIIRKNRKKE